MSDISHQHQSRVVLRRARAWATHVCVALLVAVLAIVPALAQTKAKGGSKPSAAPIAAPLAEDPSPGREGKSASDEIGEPANEREPAERVPLAKDVPATDAPAASDPPSAGETVKTESPPPPVEQPKVSSPEATYMAALDELIAPVRDLVLAPEDVQRIKDALRFLAAGDPASAAGVRSQLKEPAGRKLVEWLAFKGGFGEPHEFQAFLAANPAWPERALLIRRAEEQLFIGGGSAQKIRTFFKDSEPKTGAGWAAVASAYLAEKNEAKAKETGAKTWREFELASSLEQGFLERFGPMLTEADHRRRLDRILVDEVRFSAERNERAGIARRILPHLSEPERKKAEARIAVFLKAKFAAQMLAALPADVEGEPVDWGLAYQKVQHYRRVKQDEDAWKILRSAPTDPELIVSPDDWWAERRAAAYDALRAGKPDVAYDLVRDAGPLSANPLKDQAFMAGWIALRYLKKTDAAIKHFEASRAAADGPLGQSRADYWAGRAYESAGQTKIAQERYAAAARQNDTFHGQLGRQKMTPGSAIDIRAGLPAMPTAEEAQRFNESDAVRAAVIVHKIGLDRNIKAALFGQLRNHLSTEGEMAMLAHLAAALGDPRMSLRVGKTGISRNMNLIMYAYPLHAFPAYSPVREPPELAVPLGLARQESEFNNSTVSSAGARGIMQVMPATAQSVCRVNKIKCDMARLQTDNGYNATIASAYVGELLVGYRGNYVMAFAGYNAGPGRVQQWVREFGDPRDPGVDAIDWIERIPIEETREYVKKVLSNVQVYRARLGEETALRLEQDLTRSSGPRRAAKGDVPEPSSAKN